MVNVNRATRATAMDHKHNPDRSRLLAIRRVIGVDFSGAARPGKTAWLAELELPDVGPPGKTGKDLADGSSRPGQPPRLVSLDPLGRLAGDDRRGNVYGYLIDRILGSDETLWGFDFPFGLPLELGLGPQPTQLRRMRRFAGDAKDYGRELVARSESRLGVKHIRRQTDRETKTPFDCYHYRIIYQTFHGMRDLLGAIQGDRETAVIPFTYDRWDQARRIVAEACPSSTLKRIGLPHRHYKQSGVKPPDETHRKTRREILAGLSDLVWISTHRRRLILGDPGGDALDAILAAVGTLHGVRAADHASIRGHARYPREGYIYC